MKRRRKLYARHVYLFPYALLYFYCLILFDFTNKWRTDSCLLPKSYSFPECQHIILFVLANKNFNTMACPVKSSVFPSAVVSVDNDADVYALKNTSNVLHMVLQFSPTLLHSLLETINLEKLSLKSCCYKFCDQTKDITIFRYLKNFAYLWLL